MAVISHKETTTSYNDHVMWPITKNFHPLKGQYLQKLGRGSARVSINTANVTLGPQLMEVIVYRRHHHVYVPIAKVKDVYVVTGE